MSLFALPFHWIRRAAPYRSFWLGGPLLLYAWTVTGPYLSDDLILIPKAERFAESSSAPWDLFRFAASDEQWRDLRDRGTSPWWMPDRGRMDFLRPVSAWLIYVDLHWIGRHPMASRLAGLGVFTLSLLCLHWMFLRANPDRIRAGVATFFFGISQAATMPVIWLSNRQDLFVLIGVAIAAGAYWTGRSRPRAAWVIIAALAFTFALFAKELAVAFCGVVAAHELIRRRKPIDRWTQPAAGITAAIIVAIAVGFLAYYVQSRPWAFGIGTGDGAPMQIGPRLPISALLYSAVWTIGFPIDVLMVASEAQILALAGVAACLGLTVLSYLRRSTPGDPAALFFALWALMFVVPCFRAANPSTRSLCVATAGWTYLLAGLIVPSRESDSVMPISLRTWIFAANGAFSIGCVIGTVLFIHHWERSARDRIDRVIASLHAPLKDGDVLIAAQADSSLDLICGGDRLRYMTGLDDVAFIHLMAPDVDASFEREDSHTLIARTKGASLLGAPLHRASRGRGWSPRVGTVFRLREFTAEVADVGADGGVAAIRFRFNEPLTSPRLRFFPPELAALARGDQGSNSIPGSGSSPIGTTTP